MYFGGLIHCSQAKDNLFRVQITSNMLLVYDCDEEIML